MNKTGSGDAIGNSEHPEVNQLEKIAPGLNLTTQRSKFYAELDWLMDEIEKKPGFAGVQIEFEKVESSGEIIAIHLIPVDIIGGVMARRKARD